MWHDGDAPREAAQELDGPADLVRHQVAGLSHVSHQLPAQVAHYLYTGMYVCIEGGL